MTNDTAFEAQKLAETRAAISAQLAACETRRERHLAETIAQGRAFQLEHPFGALYGEADELRRENETRELAVHKLESECRLLQKMLDNPYFARVDFLRDGANEAERFYFGIKNLYDPETLDFHVIDWRSPVAALFYNDFEGEAYYDAPRGRITGRILLRRQFRFEGGAAVRTVDSQLKIDDDILLDALAEDAQSTLKVIVGSIQREQNRAIRHDERQNLLVTGPAGSGKTSVGLHRMAYLLYLNRQNLSATGLRSQEILTLAGSSLFASYIAGIIPELGEDDIAVLCLHDLLSALCPPPWKVSDHYEQAEALLRGDAARAEAVATKYAPDFWAALARAVTCPAAFADIRVLGHTALSAEALSERFAGEDEKSTMRQRQERVLRWGESCLDSFFVTHCTALLAEIEQLIPVHESTELHFRKLKKQTTAQLKTSIAGALQPDFLALYLRVLREHYGECALVRATEQAFARRRLLFEDAVCLLQLHHIHGSAPQRCGALPLAQMKHILLDEAQDLCAPIHPALRVLFPKARFTVLADVNQAILPAANTTEAAILREGYGAAHIALQKSYRSTQPINALALSLLDAPPYEVAARDGTAVQHIQSRKLPETLAQLLAQPETIGKSVAVITRTLQEAKSLHRALSSLTEIALLQPNDSRLRGGAVILPLALTKGLEFDRVLIPHAESFDGAAGRRYLYMMVTRALHQLTLISSTKQKLQ